VQRGGNSRIFRTETTLLDGQSALVAINCALVFTQPTMCRTKIAQSGGYRWVLTAICAHLDL
jgi:hypothetical protein